LFSQVLHKSLLFECIGDDLEERSRACPGKAEEAGAALADSLIFFIYVDGPVISMLASGSPNCWAVRTNSDHTGGKSRFPRRAEYRHLPCFLDVLVFLCSAITQYFFRCGFF
jgi:hypothetical protein